MSEDKRTDLRERIKTGKSRQLARAKAKLAQQASLGRDRLTSAAREHPVLLIAGGIALGVAISTLFPKSPTRKLSRKAAGFLGMVAELGITYGRQAMEAADEAGRNGREKLAGLGNTIADGTGRLRDKVRRNEDA